MYENGVTYQYIANATNAATDDTTLGADIAVSSVALVEIATNKVQESNMTSEAGLFRIAQKTAGGQLIYSPEFNLASKTTVTSKVYTAPAEQVTYYGYNSSSGDLGTIVSGQTYILHFDLLNYAPGVGHSPLVKTIPHVATTAVESDLATGLAQSFTRVFDREPYKLIQCDLVCDATVTTANGTKNGQNVTVVKDSIAMTFGTDVTYEAGGGETLVVGDYLRLGSVGGGTALSSPVYKVTAIDSLVVTVDRPVTNASGTYTSVSGTSDIEVVPAADGDAAGWGFKFTALDRFADSGFNAQTDFYSKVRFSLASADFDASVGTTASVVASEGVGSYYEVAQLESKYAMNDGKGKYVSAYPPTSYRGEATIGNTYDLIHLDCYSDNYTSPTTGIKPISVFTILIFMLVSLNGDDVDTAFNVSL